MYIWAISLGGIAYQAIGKLFPDKLDYRYSYSSMESISTGVMKGYLAAIIVSYPVFAVLFIHLKKLSYAKPFTKSLKSRKMLVYLSLLVTFIILLVHVIAITYGVLDGNITLRSLAYFVVTLTIAGSIFIYLLHDVREDRK